MEPTNITEIVATYPLTPLTAIGSCFGLAIFFVCSLYVWKPFGPQERSVLPPYISTSFAPFINTLTLNHPSHDPANVKRRFLSVSVSMALSPLLVHYLLHDRQPHSVLALMGLRTDGLCAAIGLPLLLTVVLFTGPLVAQHLSGELRAKATRAYWLSSATDIFWIRNHIVAPLSEEFTFRACMLPLLLAAVRPTTALVLTPLFFGVAHLHHAVERYQAGHPAAQIALLSAVQFAFTSVFGVYSAYLFARTGHYAAPVVVHAFCNHMGLPNFGEVLHEKDAVRRAQLAIAYAGGLAAWLWLLPVLTEPQLYSNAIYWQGAQ